MAEAEKRPRNGRASQQLKRGFRFTQKYVHSVKIERKKKPARLLDPRNAGFLQLVDIVQVGFVPAVCFSFFAMTNEKGTRLPNSR